jgi:hypothetical protein
MAWQKEKRRLRAGLIEVKWVIVPGEFTGPDAFRQRHPRKERTIVPVKKKCEHCGKEFTPQRTSRKFCSPKCRVYAARKRRAKQ